MWLPRSTLSGFPINIDAILRSIEPALYAVRHHRSLEPNEVKGWVLKRVKKQILCRIPSDKASVLPVAINDDIAYLASKLVVRFTNGRRKRVARDWYSREQ